MKLVHKPLTRWITVVYIATITLIAVAATAQQPEYRPHFDPAKGFKAAQTNLTNVFLQLAGSLEQSGSLEPYLRHIQSENKRITALLTEKTGKPSTGRLPDYMTEQYLDRVVSNWNLLAPKLGLDALARETGRCAREGILGTRGTGTIAIEAFNEHQKLVLARMRSATSQPAGFEELRIRLTQELEYGKENITMVGYETARRDAVSYAFIIDGTFKKMYRKLDAAAPPEKAYKLKTAVSEFFLELGQLAQVELELGILEWSLKQ